MDCERGPFARQPARVGRPAPGRWYAAVMARGWESKAVEAQQAEARGPARTGPPVSQDELERRQQLEGLRLALADATAQLQAACRPVHRDMLRQRIAAIEASLASLSAAGRGVRG